MREAEPKPTIRMVDHALKYAQRGWKVFALGENTKLPIRSSHGLLDATTDPLLIEAAWSSNPNYNIGLRTGRDSGIIVVDIDPRNEGNKSLEEFPGKLASTLLVKTPRGGYHRYYKHPGDQEYASPIGLFPGVDIRADNSYVVLPPSTLFAGKMQYRFVKENFPIAKSPDWLLKLIAKSSQVQGTEISVPYQIRREGKSEAKTDKWLLGAVGRASEGNRNQVGFQLACQLRDDGFSQSEAEAILREYAARVGQGKTIYHEREAINSVRSAYRRPPRDSARKR